MAYQLYQKLVSAMAGKGITDASEVDINASLDNTSYGKVSTIINAIISKIQTIVSEISSITSGKLNRSVVPTLPTTDISEHTIYLVPKSTPTSNNAKDEYMYVNGAWEKIGDTEVDLSGYATTAALNTGLAGKAPLPVNPTSGMPYVWMNSGWSPLYVYARGVYYDSELSHLMAVNVQDAIDELLNKINNVSFSDYQISFSYTGIFHDSTNNVRGALLELANFITGNFVDDTDPLNPVIEEDEDDNGLLPIDGNNYNIGTVSGLGISSNVDAMTIGCTIAFTASADFQVGLPYSYVDDVSGQPVNPRFPAKIVNADKLTCISGNQYLLTISAACTPTGGYMNLFNLQVLNDTSAESNEIS